ncbi:hypothetical protein CRG98_006675 [Punica granatum]|uniref:Uncharacterized protein n=1 Tax=Punica granatum TaxID=22663 RepID=A0A2I0KWX0_PUNGR|nr:hypothetical protein CRG98_006675 [Punica granatum]
MDRGAPSSSDNWPGLPSAPTGAPQLRNLSRSFSFSSFQLTEAQPSLPLILLLSADCIVARSSFFLSTPSSRLFPHRSCLSSSSVDPPQLNKLPRPHSFWSPSADHSLSLTVALRSPLPAAHVFPSQVIKDSLPLTDSPQLNDLPVSSVPSETHTLGSLSVDSIEPSVRLQPTAHSLPNPPQLVLALPSSSHTTRPLFPSVFSFQFSCGFHGFLCISRLSQVSVAAAPFHTPSRGPQIAWSPRT